MRLPIIFVLLALAQPVWSAHIDDLAAEAKQYGLRVGPTSGGTVPTGETPRRVIRLLVEAVSKGGTLALDMDDTRLEAVLRWLRVNGESLKGVSASPFDRMPFFGRATVKDNVLYLHVFAWPSTKRLKVPGIEGVVLSAELLANHTPLQWSQNGWVSLPTKAPDDTASVIKVTMKNPPRAQHYVIEPDEQGILTARAESCEIAARPGQMAFKDNSLGRVFLTNWIRAIDVPTWRIRVPRNGRYSVGVTYAAHPASAGVVYTVTMKGQTVGMAKGIVESTGNLFKTLAVGNMQLDAGDYMLLVQPENRAVQTAMDLEKVILKRIGD